MQLQSNNLKKVRLGTWLLYAIFEILLQVVFRIWFCIRREIIFCLESIQFNGESTYNIFQHLPVFKVSGKSPHTIRKKSNPGTYKKTWKVWSNLISKFLWSRIIWDARHIFCPNCRDLIYLRHIDSKVDKEMPCRIKLFCCWHLRVCFVDHRTDIQIWGYVRSNMTIDGSFIVSMTFLITQSEIIQD